MINPKEIVKRLKKIEEFINLPKGIQEPQAGEVRSSIVSPVTAPPIEEERLDIEEILRRTQEMIDNRFADLQGDIYEVINEYVNNENNLVDARRFITTTSPQIHKAYCKAAAGAAATITCYLDADATGEEITVNCDTNGGGNLNVSVPLLKDGQLLYVVKIGDGWYCFEKFNTGQTAIAFVKTTPGAVTSVSCWFSETDGTGETISVPCDIAGGGNLNAAVPRLTDGDELKVVKIGTTWHCIDKFIALDTAHFQITSGKLQDKLFTCT